MKPKIIKGIISAWLLLLGVPLFSQENNVKSLNQEKDTTMENQNKELKEYILLVYVPLSYGADEASEVRAQWSALLDVWKEDGAYVTSFVYPNAGYLVQGTQKVVANVAIVSDNYKLVSNMILRAPNHEAAVELAKRCPVLKQNGLIDVREIQPRPRPD